MKTVKKYLRLFVFTCCSICIIDTLNAQDEIPQFIENAVRAVDDAGKRRRYGNCSVVLNVWLNLKDYDFFVNLINSFDEV